MHNDEKKRHRLLKVILGTIGVIILIFVVYLLYVILTYKRLDDNLPLDVLVPAHPASEVQQLTADTDYEIITYNIGFGAYTPEYSFFMDGGKSSVAASRQSVLDTVSGAGALVQSYDPDFVMFEEVDLNATRSYHINQYELLDTYFEGYYSDFAQNWDSAFLMFPPWEPHGKTLAGITLYSRYPITSAMRRSFPISTSFSKFVDLDRCYSISRIPVDNGRELVLFEHHMSAYGNSDAIREGQVSMLMNDMKVEYDKGNYVICGGDFNHDLKAADEGNTERESWAYPFSRSSVPEGFGFCIDRLDASDATIAHDSARNADIPYEKGVTYTVTLDGFIISDNIEMTEYEHIDTGYSYSDHDPVRLAFKLKG